MLLIDDRGGSKSLVPFFPPELARMLRLESGDAAWFGHGPEGPLTYPIGVELKTVTETVQRIIDKRFVAEQFPKMCLLYKRIYYVLEGEYKEGSDGILLVKTWENNKEKWVSHGWSMSYRQFDNWQNSLSESGRIRFKKSLSRSESASQILNLYYLWTKEYENHKSLFAFDKSQEPPLLTKPSLTRRMAAQIPNIGWQRSAAVASAFGSPLEMVNAGEDQWKQVTGIGPVIAKKVVQMLRKS